jgi:prolyl-tRNA editing enzyme YbaK/EbsC (Cys-tRNA(Pro) deacylase)
MNPRFQSVVEVAARKGVALDIGRLAEAPGTAQDTARVVDVELGQIVKSILFVAPRQEGRHLPILCLLSGRNEVDLPRLAAVTGEVLVRAASAREVHDLTGCLIGSIPPFGHGRDVRVLMDQDLARHQWIWAATGADKAVFRISPRVLRVLANATVAPIAEACGKAAAAAPLGLAYGF